ncbi:MAG: hypothetical protein F4100_10175 [Rhodothermaceae bacterium]|nr:hypothetical protein [Rhodothermaceae bacterium]MYE63056.1 hypothetical protein [Rhodothermaceae bacterium]MYJ21090.1 hypothetical protein [Rhodothermaceae bacterium]
MRWQPPVGPRMTAGIHGTVLMSTSVSGRRFKNRWLVILGVVLTLGFAQTPWCLSLLARWALHASETELTFESLHGFWMHSLEVRGIEGSVGGHWMCVDTAQVKLSPGHLLTGRLFIRHMELATPIFHFRSPPSEQTADTGEEGNSEPVDFPWIESLHLQGGIFHFADQMLKISGIQIRGSISPTAIQLDTLYGDLSWQQAVLQLSATSRLQLNQGLLQLDTLLLHGPTSVIRAHGSIGRQTSLNVAAAPLSADVLGILLPNMEEDLVVAIELEGEEDSLHLALDGESENGAALKVRGSIQVGTPSVHLDTLGFENFNLKYLFADLAGELTGSLRGHVDGVSWDSLNGKIDGNLGTGVLAGVPIESASMSGDMEEGIMQVQLDSRLALGSLGLAGTVHPSSGSGQLTGQFRDLNTQVLDPQHKSALSGNFTVAWKDSLEGYMELLSGQLGTLGVTCGELRLYSGDEILQLAGILRGDSTRIALEASRQESGLTGRLEVDALDVGALMNRQNMRSQISLTVESTTNWPPDSITVQIEVQPSSWNQIPVTQAHAELLLWGQDLDVRGRIAFPSGNVILGGSAYFGASSPEWVLERGQIEGLDLRDLGIGIETELNAQLQLSGRGLQNASGQLHVVPSRMNHETISDGVISLEMSDQEAIIDSRFTIGSGGFQARANVDPFAAQPTVNLSRGAFQQVDVGALAGLDSFSTLLTGRVDSLQWGEGGYAALSLDSSAVNALEITDAQLHVKAHGDSVVASGAATLDQGYVRMEQVRFGLDRELRARGSLRNLSLRDLGFADIQLSGSLDVDMKGTPPRTMTIHHAQVEADSTRIGDVQFDRFRVAGTMEDGALQLNEFDLSSNAGRLRAQGSVSLFEESSDSLRFDGAITNPALLSAWTGAQPVAGGGTDTLWGELAYRDESLRWAAGVTTDPLTWRTMRLFQASGYAEGTLDDLKPRLSRAEVVLERLSIPTVSARRTWLRLEEQQGKIQYEARMEVDDRRSLRVEGEADLAARQGTLRQLDLYLDEAEWHLGVPTEILADDGIRVRYFVLGSQDQEITLDGILNPDGEQRLGLNLYNVQLAPFTDILGLPGLGGIANADLFFHGPATAPQLTGSVNLMVESENEQVGSVAARIDYQENGLDIEAGFVHVDESTLSVSGLLPLDLRLKKGDEVSFPDASLTLQADKFNLAWVSPFLAQDEISNLRGKLTADIGITGSLSLPNLGGELNLTEGYVRLPQLGISPSEVQLDAVLRRDTIYVKNLYASSGRGTAEGRGHVTLEASNRGGVDLAMNLEDFRVVNTAPYVADVSGSVALGRTVRSPDLTGHIEMTSAVIRPQDVPVTLEGGMINFSETDLQMLEQYFNIRASAWDTTTYSLVDALAMDLSVGIPGTVRLHSLQNPEMTVLLSGSVALSKEPYAEQELHGTVSIVPELSYLRQFGRRFDIRQGRVTFAGAATNPFFDLQAALDIPSRSGQDTPVTILLDASGRLQEPESLALELRSEPVQLDRADMISYMATGRPAADAFQLRGGGALQSGSDLALQQLSSLIAGAAGAGLGLDVVQINPETGGKVTLTAGKYVSRKLFASVKWPITEEPSTSNSSVENNRELVVEYALYPWLVARMRGEAGAMGLSLLYQYTW